MRPTRLLGAATAVLVTGTLLGSAPASAAHDNARSRWDSKRVVQLPDAPDGPVHVYGGGTDQWALVARNIGGDTWRLRESVDGELGFTNPDGTLPATVSRWQAGTLPSGWTMGAYEDGGRLYAYTKEPNGVRGPKDLAPAAPGPIVVYTGTTGALVASGDTWHQHANGGTGNDAPAAHWESYPDPNVDGVPGVAGQSFGLTNTDLLAFWNEPNGDLRVARRARADTAAAFSAPQTIAANEKVIHFDGSLFHGSYLVTQSTDGSVNVYTYTSDAAGYSFTDKRVIAGALVDAPAPQVLRDVIGTLTVGFRETGAPGGGLMLWQQDRPLGRLLERPTLVPGTRGSDARVVTSPRGNLTVAFRRDGEPGIVRVKHLPAGKRSWTDGIRLVSPKPNDTSTGWGIGTPQRNGDLRVAVNDTVGVYGFRFDAPAPYTKMTRPVRTVQQQRSYRVAANTSWAFAHEWQMRARVDKGRSYGAWSPVSLPDGENGKDVTRPRGETRCYSARGETIDGGRTRWSPQQCVTVRR